MKNLILFLLAFTMISCADLNKYSSKVIEDININNDTVTIKLTKKAQNIKMLATLALGTI